MAPEFFFSTFLLLGHWLQFFYYATLSLLGQWLQHVVLHLTKPQLRNRTEVDPNRLSLERLGPWKCADFCCSSPPKPPKRHKTMHIPVHSERKVDPYGGVPYIYIYPYTVYIYIYILHVLGCFHRALVPLLSASFRGLCESPAWRSSEWWVSKRSENSERSAWTSRETVRAVGGND